MKFVANDVINSSKIKGFTQFIVSHSNFIFNYFHRKNTEAVFYFGSLYYHEN